MSTAQAPGRATGAGRPTGVARAGTGAGGRSPGPSLTAAWSRCGLQGGRRGNHPPDVMAPLFRGKQASQPTPTRLLLGTSRERSRTTERGRRKPGRNRACADGRRGLLLLVRCDRPVASNKTPPCPRLVWSGLPGPASGSGSGSARKRRRCEPPASGRRCRRVDRKHAEHMRSDRHAVSRRRRVAGEPAVAVEVAGERRPWLRARKPEDHRGAGRQHRVPRSGQDGLRRRDVGLCDSRSSEGER
jgi:hypothetical protein